MAERLNEGAELSSRTAGGFGASDVAVEEGCQFAPPSVTVSLLFGASAEEAAAGFTTVWMHGVHDGSTAEALFVAIRRASDIDGADVMVDLSDVSSIDMYVVRAMLSAEASLQQRSLLLCARRPSSCVRRFAEANGFEWRFV